MGIISVEKVEPGMVLAEKVMTPKRMMLLPEGVELTAAHLITFQTWGITEVNIVGEDGGDADNEMSEEERAAAEEELRFIFKHNDLTKTLAKNIFDLACKHAEKKS